MKARLCGLYVYGLYKFCSVFHIYILCQHKIIYVLRAYVCSWALEVPYFSRGLLLSNHNRSFLSRDLFNIHKPINVLYFNHVIYIFITKEFSRRVSRFLQVSFCFPPPPHLSFLIRQAFCASCKRLTRCFLFPYCFWRLRFLYHPDMGQALFIPPRYGFMKYKNVCYYIQFIGLWHLQ